MESRSSDGKCRSDGHSRIERRREEEALRSKDTVDARKDGNELEIGWMQMTGAGDRPEGVND